jgi:hypothetical protein
MGGGFGKISKLFIITMDYIKSNTQVYRLISVNENNKINDTIY